MPVQRRGLDTELRGRAAGLETLIGSAGPALGDIRAGGLAARYGIRTALRSGGLACVASTGVLTAALPALWRYDRRTDPHTSAVRAAHDRAEATDGAAP